MSAISPMSAPPARIDRLYTERATFRWDLFAVALLILCAALR